MGKLRASSLKLKLSWPAKAGHPGGSSPTLTGWPGFRSAKPGHDNLSVKGAGCASLAISLVALLPLSAAHAQSIEDRLRDQLRATVNQLHQLQDDEAALQAQKAQAEQERDRLKTELAAATAEAARSRSNGEQTRETQGEVSKYKDAVTQATTTAQKAQSDQTKLQTDLANAQAMADACEAKNTALLKTGNEILDAYENFDIGDALGANETFIRIKRVEFENAAQDYDDKLRSGKFDPGKVKPPTQAQKSN